MKKNGSGSGAASSGNGYAIGGKPVIDVCHDAVHGPGCVQFPGGVYQPEGMMGDLATWIANEMNSHVNSADVWMIYGWNLCFYVNPACKAPAYLAYYDLVCSGCSWDQKGEIKEIWGMSNDPTATGFGFDRYAPVPGTDYRVYFDIWSNIHYGYIGSAAGFSEFELTAAQEYSYPGGGIADPADTIGVRIGIELYENYGDHVTPKQVMNAVMAHLEDYFAVNNQTTVCRRMDGLCR